MSLVCQMGVEVRMALKSDLEKKKIYEHQKKKKIYKHQKKKYIYQPLAPAVPAPSPLQMAIPPMLPSKGGVGWVTVYINLVARRHLA